MFAQRLFQHYTDLQEMIYVLVSVLQNFRNMLEDEIVS